MQPTVLVGLGGIGSKVVDQVVSQMNEQERKKVSTVVLDTDINDLQDLESIDVPIQTSPKVSVGNYVAKHPEVMKWFPYEPERVRRVMMTDGAGQIRSISRLALYSAIEEGKLEELKKDINKLSELKNSKFDEGTYVVIVASIAGGTGAGSFIQMGTFLRELFTEKNENAEVFIQGVFLLPDAIINTGKVKKSEWDNLRYNAYASLKELNAILSPAVQRNVEIELEYKPKKEGNHTVALNNRPFDTVVLFDYENMRNMHLGNYDEYLKLMSDSVYYGFISPLSGQYKSRFINSIRDFIAKDQEAFYGGSSINKLVYPYHDIVNYLTYEWIAEDISDSWLSVDKAFKVEQEQYLNDVRNGINRTPPNRDEVYIHAIERIKNDNDANAFSKEVYRQTQIIDEKNDTTTLKNDTFILEVQNHISSAIENDNKYNELKSDCSIDTSRLIDIADAQDHIAELESSASILHKNINKVIDKHANSLLSDIVFNTCNSSHQIQSKYALSYWIAGENDVMHPVAVRYFIYKVMGSLTEEINNTKNEIKSLESSFDAYTRAYNIESEYDTDSETYYESAIEVLDIISDMGVVDKLKNIFNDELKFGSFTTKYKRNYSGHIYIIDQLTQMKLKLNIFEKLLLNLTTMSRQWEKLFDLLSSDLLINIYDERNKLLHEHSHIRKDIIVFGDVERKKQLWDDIKARLGSGINSNISLGINKEQYALFCEKHNDKREKKVNREDFKNILVNAYQNMLIEKVDSEINLNIEEAVTKEQVISNYTSKNLEEYLVDLTNMNHPWMTASSDPQQYAKFWGVQDGNFIKNINTEGNAVVDERFSSYEVVYLVMYYTLTVDVFNKFAITTTGIGEESKGSYFRAYHNLIDNIKKDPEKHITPHLDKRWDSPVHMPDLNKGFAQQQEKNVNRSFILGIVNGALTIHSADGKNIFAYTSKTEGTHPIKVHKKTIDASKWSYLYNALRSNPGIVDSVITNFENQLAKDTADINLDVENIVFIKDVVKSGVLDHVLQIAYLESKTPEERELTNILLSSLDAEITYTLNAKYGEVKQNSAEQHLNKTKKEMWEASEFYKRARNEDNELIADNWKSTFGI